MRTLPRFTSITNLTVRGTGSSGATSPGIAVAAIEINATGAWLENVLVDGASSVGVRLFFVDSSTTLRNMTIRDAGEAGQGAHSAGLSTWLVKTPFTCDEVVVSIA